MAKDLADEYNASLADLRINSKPHINMLTMLAEDYIENAPIIVKSVEAHLDQVEADVKLPVLYLIDSIVKNVGKDYVSLFSQNIVKMFSIVFERSDEKNRSQLFKLRQTWNEVFSTKLMHELDIKVNGIDPAWPVSAVNQHSVRIHVNPKFFHMQQVQGVGMREELLKQKKELLELQKRKVELELLQTKAILEERQKKFESQLFFNNLSEKIDTQGVNDTKDPNTVEVSKPLDFHSKDPRLRKNIKNKIASEECIKSPSRSPGDVNIGEEEVKEDKTDKVRQSLGELSDTDNRLKNNTEQIVISSDDNSSVCSQQSKSSVRSSKRKINEKSLICDKENLKDVDLRVFASCEPVQDQVLDHLFGEEDTDLRQTTPLPEPNEKIPANCPMKKFKSGGNFIQDEIIEERNVKQPEEQLDVIPFASCNNTEKLNEGFREPCYKEVAEPQLDFHKEYEVPYPRFNEPWVRRVPPPRWPGPRFNRPFFFDRHLGRWPHGVNDFPPADPCVLDMIAKDTMQTVDIDHISYFVRFYGNTAVVFLSWDDPREVSFYPGIGQLIIDDCEFVPLPFNAPYRKVNIDGIFVELRIGAPTRELYIDGIFYEVPFGGLPVQIMIGCRLHTFQLAGPSPQIRVGNVRRTDLVAGKINLTIDSKHIYPVFLDAKPQRFDINGVPYILRFVEALQTVVINGIPFKAEFGSNLQIPMFFRGETHFLRFSALPRGIKPGFINIINMERGNLAPVCPQFLPLEQNFTMQPPIPTLPEHIPVPTQPQPIEPLNCVPSVPVKIFPSQNFVPASCAEEGLNVGELMKKLVAVGIVPPVIKKPKEAPEMKLVSFSQPETLKIRQPGLITLLYSGIQCSSCGVRFPPEQTVKYSQHLDWHFRHNRRDRDSVKKVLSRRWNYEIPDWLQFKEIEEEEERPLSLFETQDEREEDQDDLGSELEFDDGCTVSCVEEDNCCSICFERFDQFYNNEKEQWRLKGAIKIDGKLFHSICFKDNYGSFDSPEDITDPPNDTQASDEDILEVKVLEQKVEYYELSDDDELVLPEKISELLDEEIEFSLDCVKQEKIEVILPVANPPPVLATIDGNVELAESSFVPIPKKIKINITSSLAKQDKTPVEAKGNETAESAAESELKAPASIKPKIAQAELAVQEPSITGTEMSALCTIL